MLIITYYNVLDINIIKLLTYLYYISESEKRSDKLDIIAAGMLNHRTVEQLLS